MNLAFGEELFGAKVLRHAASFCRFFFFLSLSFLTYHISLSTQTSSESKKESVFFSFSSLLFALQFSSYFFFLFPSLHLIQSNDERQPNSASILVFWIFQESCRRSSFCQSTSYRMCPALFFFSLFFPFLGPFSSSLTLAS
jgi:cytochrome bd-type quinol oxidase subunit 2